MSHLVIVFFLLHLHIFEDILLPGLGGMLLVTQNYGTAGKTLHLLYNIPQNLLMSIPVQCSKRGSLNLWGRWRHSTLRLRRLKSSKLVITYGIKIITWVGTFIVFSCFE